MLVPALEDGARLVDVARAHLVVVARRAVGPLVVAGGVLVEGHPGRVDDRVSAGARLTVSPAALANAADGRRLTVPHDPTLEPRIEVRHRDEDLLVVVKPHGVHMAPMGRHRTSTLLGSLLWLAGARPDRPWGAWRPHPGHRLDRATAGLVAVLTSPGMHARFQASLVAGQVERGYRARVMGHLTDEHGTVDAPLGVDPALDYRRAVVADGQPAVTHWRVVDRGPTTTVVELRLDTGRTHQIRAHLASIGHPIVGDDLYAPDATGRGDATSRIELVADHLRLPHPRTGVTLQVDRTDW